MDHRTVQLSPKKRDRSRKGLEFKAAAKLAMFQRAGGPEDVHCEGCGLRLGGKPFDYDHTVEIWELPFDLIELFRKNGVPAEYGKLLGKNCCHKAKSARKAGERAHCKRIVEKAARVKKKSSFLTNRDGEFKKKMDGTVVRRG